MDWRNRIGLYGCYFLGMAGVGFTLPYLTVLLKDRGFSDWGVGVLATCAALAGLIQFPVGLWPDRVGRRKPFIVVVLALLAASMLLLYWSREWLWLSFLVLLFAENGACRATVESLAGDQTGRSKAVPEVRPAVASTAFC
jgi:MFS family permease